jgi:hypothetical protein
MIYMAMINFKATPYKIGDWTVLRLPKDASLKLPSRGQVMVKGTIDGYAFQTALEPDGDWSHWLNIDADMQRLAKVAAGKPASLAIESAKDWPEPKVPADIQNAIKADTTVRALWEKITPLARWEWIRWINSTNQPATRQHRIEVACSKMTAGERRPCCFNRNMCCVPEVSKSGVLLEP